ncbi:MAG: hypothetical protein M1828_007610 [Chrysothrix sp. TS-e1954]|nr:MAG: hypothetical protein M1828_007610 [Chrysothrix sp. TS-e1954]
MPEDNRCPRWFVHSQGMYGAARVNQLSADVESRLCYLCRRTLHHTLFWEAVRDVRVAPGRLENGNYVLGLEIVDLGSPDCESGKYYFLESVCSRAETDARDFNTFLEESDHASHVRCMMINEVVQQMAGTAAQIWATYRPLQTLFPGEFINPVSPTGRLEHANWMINQANGYYMYCLVSELRAIVWRL